MQIKFIDLSRQYKQDKNNIIKSIDDISNNGDFILGDSLKSFEKSFSKFCGTKYSLGLNSGSDALFIFLKSLNLKPDDEIIIPTLSFIATAWAAGNSGAKVIYCDTKNDMNIDPIKIEQAITKKTKVIIPVHLTGRVCDMTEIVKICRKRKIILVEDAAQAFGAKYKNRYAGSFGDIAGFSLHPLKVLNVMGDGGVLTTNKYKTYKEIELLRNHGLYKTNSLVWGYNSRLDNIQAAVANIRLKKIKKRIKINQKIAKLYNSQLSDILTTPRIHNYEEPTFHRYIIHIENRYRDKFRSFLNKKNIETKINYGIPLHLQKSSSHLKYKKGTFPVSENLSKTMVSIPLYSELKEIEVEYIINNIKKFFK